MKHRRAAVALVSLLLLALTEAGCTSGSRASSGGQAIASMPPPLTSAAATTVPFSSPNGRSREESVRILLLGSNRYATIEQAAAALPFVPRLPAFTAGTKLEYLLVDHRAGSTVGPVFGAVYSAGALELLEWKGGVPGLEHANASVGGLPAIESRPQIRHSGATQMSVVSEILWTRDGISYNLTYEGPMDVAVKIAQSIPSH